MARVVAGHVRPGDLALRLGGDEFAVIIADEHDPAGPDGLDLLRATAEARAHALREAVVATDWERIAPGLAVRLSIGVAVGVLGSARARRGGPALPRGGREPVRRQGRARLPGRAHRPPP